MEALCWRPGRYTAGWSLHSPVSWHHHSLLHSFPWTVTAGLSSYSPVLFSSRKMPPVSPGVQTFFTSGVYLLEEMERCIPSSVRSGFIHCLSSQHPLRGAMRWEMMGRDASRVLVCLEKALSKLSGVDDKLTIELASGKNVLLFFCSIDKKVLRSVSVGMFHL